MFLNPDKSLTVFSSKGKLDQCDNALRAAMNSSLAIGCAGEDGCVLVSFKNVSSLIVKEQYYKVFSVCPTIGVSFSGLQPDFHAQLALAQEVCQDYFDVYERFPTLDVFIAEFSIEVQNLTQRKGYRPFGTFLIFVGSTREGPCCMQIDPSGSYRSIMVSASGVGYADACKFVERRRGLLDDNIVNSLGALRDYAGKEFGPKDVSIGVYESSKGRFRVFTQEQIDEVFDAQSS
ncbi:20S proteasome subunit alpha 2 [Pancytospora philotis]|nr:20S proteasome subunit alpha 2 [Pancytospora philotis]